MQVLRCVEGGHQFFPIPTRPIPHPPLFIPIHLHPSPLYIYVYIYTLYIFIYIHTYIYIYIQYISLKASETLYYWYWLNEDFKKLVTCHRLKINALLLLNFYYCTFVILLFFMFYLVFKWLEIVELAFFNLFFTFNMARCYL